jgi:Ran GTPase-activating protein (RanGAP) involved in mRNA processing and transport
VTDFNHFIEALGEALGLNTHLEGLSLKENKLKQVEYCNFWTLMSGNRSLKKMNLQKTEITNKVCVKLGSYLMQPQLNLHDLNLSRNLIETDGLIALSEALHINKSIVKLNLAQNMIQEGGLEEFVAALKANTSLKELCLSLNKINNSGLEAFSGFLATNNTMTVLDLSKNQFSDYGFVHFAK